ncbi:MAG: NAD(+)/NADH kinase [Candidatus Ancillula trichonymphae]|jgi:NAD+ kinase|nr:NAD(+)/NADH kinase [Candidatus Ancillula trichonymphae]
MSIRNVLVVHKSHSYQGAPCNSSVTDDTFFDEVVAFLKSEGVRVGFGADDAAAYDLAISLGGDGTILSAAELLRGTSAPIYGINLGHVGFLAEGTPLNALENIRHLLNGECSTQERRILKVQIAYADGTHAEDWAINEAALEKAGVAGEYFGMLNARLEVDSVALSSYGCDGIIVSTPTGSTAHAFSAGGPIIWPEVEAIVVVPVAAHALFSRPIVLGSSSELKLYIDETAAGFATLMCDGRRAHKLPVGSTLTLKQDAQKLYFASVNRGSFTDILVQKFKLPVQGWKQSAAKSGRQ